MEKDPISEKIDLAKIRENISGWAHVKSSKEVDLQEFTVCLTNKLYGLTNKTIEQDIETREGGDEIRKRIIYRIFGKMQVPLLDRPFENEIMARLAEIGLSPKIYYSDENIRMEEFIYGREIIEDDKTNRDMFLQICNVMARFHTLFRNEPTIRKTQSKWLLSRIVDDRFLVDYIASLDKFKDRAIELKTKEFVKKYVTGDELSFLSKSLKKVSQHPDNAVICHNDIHWGNILYVEPTNTYFVIDYEYASSNPRANDIANFFNEFNFSYGEKEPPYFSCSIDRFPSESYIYEFCLYYCFFTHCPRENFKEISSKSFEEFITYLKSRDLFDSLESEARTLVKEVYILGMLCNYFWILVFILTYNENDYQISPEEYVDARIRCYDYFKNKVNTMFKEVAPNPTINTEAIDETQVSQKVAATN